MPILRAEKIKLVEDLTAELKDSRVVYIFDYEHLSSKQNADLRDKVFEHGGKIKMISNNLLRIALKNLSYTFELPEKPLALAYGFTDEIAGAKLLADFGKDTEALGLQAGWIDEKFVESTGLSELAKLPGKEALQAQVVGRLAGMLQGLVYNLSFPRHQLVFALKDLENKKG